MRLGGLEHPLTRALVRQLLEDGTVLCLNKSFAISHSNAYMFRYLSTTLE